MNTAYRKPLPGTALDYFDARAAVDAHRARRVRQAAVYGARARREPRASLRPGDPRRLACGSSSSASATCDFPWFPARVVCHDILGQTALVDLAGLRDAIAEQGGDPAQVNPVVPVQLIVDHSLAVECGGFDPDAFAKNRADRRSPQRRPLPLHRLDQARVQERRRDSAGQRHHAPDQPGADVAGDPRAGRRRVPGHAASAPTATRRTSMRSA